MNIFKMPYTHEDETGVLIEVLGDNENVTAQLARERAKQQGRELSEGATPLIVEGKACLFFSFCEEVHDVDLEQYS